MEQNLKSGLLARRVSREKPTVSSSWSMVHEAASGRRQPGHSRRTLHLWAWLGLIGHFGTETPAAVFKGRKRHGRAGEGKWT